MFLRPEYALAHTTARSGRYQIWTPSGVVEFEACDAPHALAGATKIGQVICLRKFGPGTEADEHWLALELSEHPRVGLARAPKTTRICGIDVMRGAVSEVLATGLCIDCDGHGWIREKDAVVNCVTCESTGRAAWSLRRRARACGIDKATLRHTAWGTIYDDARRVLIQNELAALLHMARRL